MEKPQRRLTAVLAGFVVAVIAAGSGVTADTVRAVESAITVKMREVGGRTLETAKVDVAKVGRVLPRSLEYDFRQLEQAVTDEIAYRGPVWSSRALHLALRDYLLAPLAKQAATMSRAPEARRIESLNQTPGQVPSLKEDEDDPEDSGPVPTIA